MVHAAEERDVGRPQVVGAGDQLRDPRRPGAECAARRLPGGEVRRRLGVEGAPGGVEVDRVAEDVGRRIVRAEAPGQRQRGGRRGRVVARTRAVGLAAGACARRAGRDHAARPARAGRAGRRSAGPAGSGRRACGARRPRCRPAAPAAAGAHLAAAGPAGLRDRDGRRERQGGASRCVERASVRHRDTSHQMNVPTGRFLGQKSRATLTFCGPAARRRSSRRWPGPP